MAARRCWILFGSHCTLMHCTEKEKTRSGNSGAFYCLRFAALFVEALR